MSKSTSQSTRRGVSAGPGASQGAGQSPGQSAGQSPGSGESGDASLTLPFLVMLITPLFFSSNLIFGRLAIPEVAPFTLAFLRWTGAALFLAPWVYAARKPARAYLRAHTGHWLLLGFLGMWICGAIVYLALQTTTATNGTLIYTTSPLIILLIERLFYGRPISWREFLGILIGFSGVAIIVLRGDVNVLLALDFNRGDLLLFGAAISWAAYSVLLRRRSDPGAGPSLGTLAQFGLNAIAGIILLAPFALWEFLTGARMPVTATAWSGIGGIILFASLLSFSGFQYGIARLGAATAGVFMYLMPPYGVALAVFLLGETFERYHAIGIATVLAGLVLATFRRPYTRRQAAGSAV
ncbi:DMT family transporter [Pseudohoeflea coraliihabitans]|uniref:EamA family transporter n=1 Tax=Pseudohoeflea coraliihabitans TaxID=2860393 RepID=A0ABS6WR21_9HYPH|nr:DMT family transporter [Pseudohoeflea sp. DP4N28-3]MBW3098421.1 EamA family transporter [Pseudohoeflea sp. DP4N28-3]